VSDWTPQRCYENSSGMQGGYGPWPRLPEPGTVAGENLEVGVAPPIPDNLTEWLYEKPGDVRYYRRRFRVVFDRVPRETHELDRFEFRALVNHGVMPRPRYVPRWEEVT
jgi:hypothetical protein